MRDNFPDIHQREFAGSAQCDLWAPRIGGSKLFWGIKRCFDIFVSLLLAPLVIIVAVILFLVNPLWNKGPVFFRQQRMGSDLKAFTVLKFRTMTNASKHVRGANDPVEKHLITQLGAFLRASRLDELPQVINVLRGEMSLIGPRPDFWDHAAIYCQSVKNYRKRHCVKPGISGLAQVVHGYAEGLDATRQKTKLDLYYVRNASFRLEAWITWKTIEVILRRRGT